MTTNLTTETEKTADTENTAPKVRRTLAEEIMALLETIERFSAVLEHETAALRQLDFKTVDTLQEDKRNLARAYQEQVHSVFNRKDDIPALDVRLRETFINKRTAFTQLLTNNMRVLNATKDSAKKLTNRILDIARQNIVDEKHTHYSAKGRTASYQSASMSFNVDQTL